MRDAKRAQTQNVKRLAPAGALVPWLRLTLQALQQPAAVWSQLPLMLPLVRERDPVGSSGWRQPC